MPTSGDAQMKTTLVVLCLLLFASRCHADDRVGIDTGDQSCEAELIQVVSDRLSLPDLQPDGGDGGASPLIASACKSNPVTPGQTYVALAYDEGIPDTKTLVLAIVESNRVLADYRSEIVEDADLTLEADSLSIDTARYTLAKGVRAFGLDVKGWASPNCGDGGLGPTRSLYVREGGHIRPVLTDMYLSSWRYIAQGQGRCSPMAPADTPTITKETRFFLSVLPDVTHGFHDLQVTALSSRDDGTPGEPAKHWTLKYDGKRYPTPNPW